MPSCSGSETHVCPVGLLGAVEGGVVDRGWCFDSWAERVATRPLDLPESAWPPPDWMLYRHNELEIAYAPFDWTNVNARVALVGITPDRHQSWIASLEAAAALHEGATYEQALRRADRIASFGGPMRRNLVTMLDEIGVAESLDIGSCDDLFGSRHDLAAHLSAVAFPVFLNGRNYSGANIARVPQLVAVIRQVLAAQLLQAEQALVVPLGKAAAEAIQLLIERNRRQPRLATPNHQHLHRPPRRRRSTRTHRTRQESAQKPDLSAIGASRS